MHDNCYFEDHFVLLETMQHTTKIIGVIQKNDIASLRWPHNELIQNLAWGHFSDRSSIISHLLFPKKIHSNYKQFVVF